jgi:PadR family transcriptional regulator PadR
VITLSEPKPGRSAASLEENLKKALTELFVLKILSEKPCYIGELTDTIRERSNGFLSIVFPYAAFYRIYEAGFLVEDKKRIAPDGRLRQYYKITDEGRLYLASLLETYHRFFDAACKILEIQGDDNL